MQRKLKDNQKINRGCHILADLNTNTRDKLIKKRIALFSLLVSIFLIVVKIIIAYLTNSLGVYSEVLNNGLDLVLVLITYIAIRASIKPADKDHTYGHGKYENFSALIELTIISLLSFFIIYKSIQRIIYKNFELNLVWYAYLVLAVSIAVNIIRVFFLNYAAKKYSSIAFRSNFINYTGDIFSSAIVLIGLIFAKFGIHIADPIASMIVAVILIIFTLRFSFRIVRNLLDYIPAEVTENINNILNGFPAIKKINNVKIHEVGNIKFMNIDLELDSNLHLSQVEKIKEDIRSSIISTYPESDIIIETKLALSENAIADRVKEIILNIPHVKDIHNIYIHNIDKYIDISVHIELTENVTLSDAEIITKFAENKLKELIAELRRIYIHIEDKKNEEIYDDITDSSENLIKEVKNSISHHINPDTCHNFTVLKRNELFNLSFHCRLDSKLNIKKAHSIITEIEDDIKGNFKGINEIAIHVEPE